MINRLHKNSLTYGEKQVQELNVPYPYCKKKIICPKNLKKGGAGHRVVFAGMFVQSKMPKVLSVKLFESTTLAWADNRNNIVQGFFVHQYNVLARNSNEHRTSF